MDDRALQDELIRYLSDAQLRAAPPQSLKLTGDEAAKAQKFARFLARRYYRDRLIRSFRYSRLFSAQTGRRAEEICESETFEPFLGQCLLGSVDSARRAAEMAAAHLAPGQRLFPWWSSLTEYESAHLLQTATTERAQPGQHYQRASSAICSRFDWALPEMLPRLRRGETVGEEFRRGVTLLFSRTHMGKIYVVELDGLTEAIFRATDGFRSVEQIAEAASVNRREAVDALNSLAEIGAEEKPV